MIATWPELPESLVLSAPVICIRSRRGSRAYDPADTLQWSGGPR